MNRALTRQIQEINAELYRIAEEMNSLEERGAGGPMVAAFLALAMSMTSCMWLSTIASEIAMTASASLSLNALSAF
jgi:hypothetical protein